MFKNYLKISLRNLRKNKAYSFINIAGLAIGIACCMLLFLFVHNEWTYDAFHQNADRIFRVVLVTTNRIEGGMSKMDVMPAPVAPALREKYPEIEHAVRMTWGGGAIKHGDEQVRPRAWYVDSDFLEMFSFPLLGGNPKTALQNPGSIVLTQEKAVEYFGSAEAMGKSFMIENGPQKYELTVTAIVGNIPQNSSIQFQALIPLEMIRLLQGEQQLAQWRLSSVVTFVQLAAPAQATALQAKLPEFVKTHFNFPSPPEGLELQALRDIHLNPEIRGTLPTSNPIYSYVLVGIAVLILLLGCINFMNLSIGQYGARVKEIGVRKIAGARRLQLVRQFIGEAILMSFFALILGFIFAELTLPFFNHLAEKRLTIWDAAHNFSLPVFVMVILGVGALAGCYPAFLVTAFQPKEILKNKVKFSGSNWLSRLLIIFQFGISIFLLVSAITMAKQLRFMKHKDLGLIKELVVCMSGDEKFYELYRNEVLTHSGVVGVTSTSGIFTGGGVTFSVRTEAGEDIWMRVLDVDYNFLDMLEIKLATGRNFQRGSVSDMKGAIIVNETFAKKYGRSIGAKLPSLQGLENPVIIGVVKDFHFKSLHTPIEPLMMYYRPGWGTLIKIRPHDISGTLAFLKEKWQALKPNETFRYSFLDEQIDAQYKNEERWSVVATSASALAIVVACLGLFGLTLLAAVRRTKEIGIRKVLGATVSDIIFMLSNGFTKLVAIAFVVATPLAWWAMNEWLQNFAYRTEAGWPIFAVAGGAALLIALLTVSTQALKAALANPVEALRYE